jgi:NAD(P)-dependent dehydrogenase (short-subunit alcohol dehydrogenase family)
VALDDLTGRTAVVTGAGSGIGRALTHRLVDEGMQVVAVDIERPAVEQTEADAPDGPGSVSARVVDVADAAAVGALAGDVFSHHDTVHLLCNNAGVFQGGLAWDRSPDDWSWALGVNLYGLINGVQAFLPRMLDVGEPGQIVNTASMAGHVCAPYAGPYQVSKFAAYGYSESLAHDLVAVDAPIGVSVLCPSLVATNIARSGRNRPETRPGGGGDDVEFVEQVLAQTTGELGLDPPVVAGLVVDAVRAGDFFVPTNDDHRTWLQDHTEDLLARRLPRMVDYS